MPKTVFPVTVRTPQKPQQHESHPSLNYLSGVPLKIILQRKETDKEQYVRNKFSFLPLVSLWTR